LALGGALRINPESPAFLFVTPQQQLKQLQDEMTELGLKVKLTLTPQGVLVEGDPPDLYLAKAELRIRKVKVL